MEPDCFWTDGHKTTFTDLPGEMLSLLDRTRLEKVRYSAPGSMLLQSLGTGLLLQYGLRKWPEEKDTGFRQVSLKEVVRFLGQYEGPLPVEYTKSTEGKPDFAKNVHDLHFSLSHSGSYCLCVLGDRPLGADLQCRGSAPERLVERYFSEQEKKRFGECRTDEEKTDCFFDMWVCKEAYGKLSGRGIAKSVSVDTTGCYPNIQSEKVKWLARGKKEDFYYAVCYPEGRERIE